MLHIDTPHDLEALNTQFRLGEHIQLTEGPGGLLMMRITGPHASAVVSLAGGQVLAYIPSGAADVLWVSKASRYEAGKAIRGGIPICWPWFGPNDEDPDKPSHGFARNAAWTVTNTRLVDMETVQVRLRLTDDALTRSLWPHAFELEEIVTVGKSLHVALIVRNTGDVPFGCTGALHSYLSVNDVRGIAVHGLDGCTYIDQLDPNPRKVQEGPVRFDRETDNIYLDTQATCVVDDPGSGRRIHVSKEGSRSTVVWNPWIAKAARMADFGDDEYTGMLCIEAANAADDAVTVAPGDSHTLATEIWVDEP